MGSTGASDPGPTRGRRRFAVAAVGALVALAAVKFWPLLRPWDRVHYGGDLSLGIEGQFYGLLKRGVVFLWDPTMVTGNLTIGGGTHGPFSTPALFHLFYPPGMLVFALAERERHVPHAVLVYFLVAHFVAAGAFTVWYARALGAGRIGAVLAGGTFMLATPLMTHFAHWHFVATLAWLPLALLGVERLLARPTAARATLAALPLALAFLAGHPQAFVYVAFAVGFTSLVGLGGLVGDAGGLRAALPALRPRALALAGAGATAALLAAVLLLPVLEIRAWERQPPELYGFDWKSQGSLLPGAIAKVLLPNAMTLVSGVQHSETALYLGVLPLVLAVLGALTVRTRAARGHAALALVALALAFGPATPVYRLAYDLVPGIGMNRIPGRALLLFAFSASILAGFGADRLAGPAGRRVAVRARRALARPLAVAAVLTVAVLLGQVLGLEAATAIDVLATDLVVLTGLGFAALGVLAAAARGASARALGRLVLGVALVDLLFWGFTFGDGERDPDQALADNPDVIDFLLRDAGWFRLGSRDTATVPVVDLYRHSWPVYDEESRLLEPAVQDLYFLTETNPRIIDLLGVKYVLGGRHRTVRTRYPTLDVSADVPAKDVPLDGLGPVSVVGLTSSLRAARDVGQGTAVATVVLETGGGAPVVLPVRAGLETAEWGWDHPLLARPPHARAAVARTWSEREGFLAHEYTATWRLERAIVPRRLRLRYHLDHGGLEVPSLRLDATEAATLPTRFRPVHRLVEANRDALPRAFLVPAVRVVPDRDERLRLMAAFDPEALALVHGAPPGLDLSPLAPPAPLEPGEGATLVSSRWFRVVLRATAHRPRLLVLSDTWSRWWTATVDGRPSPVLVADHALRGVVLPPGTHEVVFRFRYPVFWIGAGLSAAAWLGVGLVLARAWRRQVL